MQRLKTRTQFQAALAGHMLSKTRHFALHSCALDLESVNPDKLGFVLFALHKVWLGAMVPKRWAKRAVTRNTIKRQIYNVSSALEASLPQRAHVVRLRAGFDRTQFKSASSDVLNAAVRTELFQLFDGAYSPVAKAPKNTVSSAPLA